MVVTLCPGGASQKMPLFESHDRAHFLDNLTEASCC